MHIYTFFIFIFLNLKEKYINSSFNTIIFAYIKIFFEILSNKLPASKKSVIVALTSAFWHSSKGNIFNNDVENNW